MKKLIPVFLTLFSALAIAQSPCINGSASGYPCDGIDLQSRISLNEMNANAGNDSWGWTDPQDGTEYAIMCLSNGTAFIDISDPINPIFLGKLPTHTSSSTWRDVKVYNDHAFIVSEASNHGMQVFDLTRLRSVANAPETFTEDAHYNQFGKCHNIVINEETGFAYAVGTSTYGGGPHFVNIQDPTNPVAAGGFSGDNYCHDAQVIIYDGPDTDYTGREIFFGSNEDRISIVDVTDKNNPQPISTGFYANVEYTHQGWLTEDRNYYILGDEQDELYAGFNTRTIIFDVSDLDNPHYSFEYEADDIEAIDHNGYILEDNYYLSSYRAGLRIFDISDVDNGNMNETKYFDTYPSNDGPEFDGAWSVYPYFASGNIVISDINRGFFLVKESVILGVNENEATNFAIFPNPATSTITVSSKAEPVSQVEIYNLLGQKVVSLELSENLSQNVDVSELSSGMYIMKINSDTAKQLLIN